MASDIYGLGATLFCALTGHAAFERRSGEQVVAHFLRIAAEPLPDLKQTGIPGPVARAIERAMAREPDDRPGSVAEYGELLREVQRELGVGVDEMALPSGRSEDPIAVGTDRPAGALRDHHVAADTVDQVSSAAATACAGSPIAPDGDPARRKVATTRSDPRARGLWENHGRHSMGRGTVQTRCSGGVADGRRR